MKQLKISLIIAVFNGEETLNKAILSVINQENCLIELIIIDGGSTDNTINIIKKYQPHIAYWISEPDNGPAEAINKGIKKASGDIIAFLFADDWYEKNTFSNIEHAFLNSPSADIISCGGKVVSHSHNENSYITKLSYQGKKALSLSLKNIFFGTSAISCRFFNKKFFDKLAFFETKDKRNNHLYICDKELLLRARKLQAKELFISHLGHRYLSHEKSTTFCKKPIIKPTLYEQHIWIADKLLNSDCSNKKDKRYLKKVIRDQHARLFYYHLLQHNPRQSLTTLKILTENFKATWAITLVYLPIKVIFSRISRKIQQKYIQHKISIS